MDPRGLCCLADAVLRHQPVRGQLRRALRQFRFLLMLPLQVLEGSQVDAGAHRS